MMFFSVLVTLSSSSWLVCWMMMEVSSFFFVPILLNYWSVSSVVSSLKYFVVQSIGSSVFLFSVLYDSILLGGWEWVYEEKEMGLVACVSMVLKLGIFPFSGWMVHMSENLSWKKFFLLSSIQEVIPLLMISKFSGSEGLVVFVICLGMFMLVMFCFSSISIHWMMMVSSLFNVCWMTMASIISKESLMFFLLVYFSILFIFFWILEEVISISSLAFMSSFSIFKGGKMLFIFVVFMIMGVPPMGSFLGKVEVLVGMMVENLFGLSVYFLVISSIFMFLYLKMSLCISAEMGSSKANLKIPVLKVAMMIWVVMFFLVWMV